MSFLAVIGVEWKVLLSSTAVGGNERQRFPLDNGAKRPTGHDPQTHDAQQSKPARGPEKEVSYRRLLPITAGF